MKVFKKYLSLLLLAFCSHAFGADSSRNLTLVASGQYTMAPALSQVSSQYQNAGWPTNPSNAATLGAKPARCAELVRTPVVEQQRVEPQVYGMGDPLTFVALSGYETQTATVCLHDYKAQVAQLSVGQLQKQEIPKLQNTVARLERSVAEFKQELASVDAKLEKVNSELVAFENRVWVVRGIKYLWGELNTDRSYQFLKDRRDEFVDSKKILSTNLKDTESALAQPKAELAYAKNFLAQRIKVERIQRERIAAQELEQKVAEAQLKEVQKFYGDIANSGPTVAADQPLLYAINYTVFDKGATSHQAYNKLTAEAQQLLKQNNISPEKFESLTGNALQKHLFERTCTILDQSADLASANKGNEVLAPYFEATTQGCAAAMDMIRTGTPQEAIGATKLSSTLHQTTRLVVAVVKGAAEGAVSTVTSLADATMHPVRTAQELGHAIKFLAKATYDEKVQAEIGKIIDSFKHLPLDQQVQQVTALITTFVIPCPTTLLKCPALAKTLDSVKVVARTGLKAAKTSLSGLKIAEPVVAAAASAAGRVEQVAARVIKVANMTEFLEKCTFGRQIDPFLEKTKKLYQNQSIFRVTKDIGDDLKKGYYLYLDGHHKDHLEVFTGRGKFHTVLNLDGTRNLSKIEAATNRSISRLL